MKDENYFVVNGWMINQLGLKGNDLTLYAIIYGFSQDGESYFTGSLKYLSECLGCSRNTVINSLAKLEESGLIFKKQESRNGVVFNSFKAVLSTDAKTGRGVQNLDGGGANFGSGGGAKFAPNKYTSSDNYNDKGGATEKTVAPTLFPEQDKERKTLFKNSLVGDFEKFKKQFEKPEFQNIDLLHYFNAVNDWSDTKNVKRTASGWVATARTWMRTDYGKGALKLVNKQVKEDLDYQEYLKMGDESGY